MPRRVSDRSAALQSEVLALIRNPPAEADLEARIEALLAEVLADGPLPQLQPVDDDDGPGDNRIVITGLGVVSPFGIGADALWQGLSAGRSAIRTIAAFDTAGYSCRVAGSVPDFNPADFMDSKEAKRMSRSSQLAVAAARLAVAHARLNLDQQPADAVGTLIGCGTSSMPDIEQAAQTFVARGGMRLSPFFLPSALPNMPAAQVAMQLGLTGYTSAISTACAAGAQAIGEAAEVLRRGDADIMLAGGTEGPLTAFTLGAFGVIRALSSGYNDTPERASRPFDSGRDGFVPAEGAGVLVLERLSDARRRGATVLAELIGYGVSADAYHVTAPDPSGSGAARAIRRALQQARLQPQQIDYINAHATSTPAGDIAETRAIKAVFGEYAPHVPISANKSMIGHLTGAAGAVEAAATVLSLQHNLIPPTINLDRPDPECDLDYVPHHARSARLQIALSNSFGFGGVNAVLALKKL